MRIFIFTLGLCIGTVFGEQISFTSKEVGNAVQFDYTWRGANGTPVSTSFMLNAEDVRAGYTEFQPFKKEAYELKLLNSMQEEGKKISKILGVEVDIKVANGIFNTSVRGQENKLDKALAYLEERKPVVEEAIFKDSYYKNARRGNVNVVSPDYAAITNRYIGVMYYIAEALNKTAGSNLRSAITHYLDFIRTIPYSTQFLNNADFQTPIGMLIENKGDCDTKSIAFAALMSNFDIPIIFLLLPEHMLIGIAIPAELGDATLVIEGKVYVLAETAGPALIPIGQIDANSSRNIQLGAYSILSIK